MPKQIGCNEVHVWFLAFGGPAQSRQLGSHLTWCLCSFRKRSGPNTSNVSSKRRQTHEDSAGPSAPQATVDLTEYLPEQVASDSDEDVSEEEGPRRDAELRPYVRRCGSENVLKLPCLPKRPRTFLSGLESDPVNPSFLRQSCTYLLSCR